jgi:hypothetical protein
METRRWTNPGQPQTLQIAVFLLYFHAVLNVLFGAVFHPIGLILTVASAGAGFGIANEKRWAYIVGVVVAAFGLLPFAQAVWSDGITRLLDLDVMIALVFPVALFALLIHPHSRDYQRIWFS